jgi:hypothetical protein
MLQNTAAKNVSGATMSDATFGQAATFNTEVGFSLDVSPDKKAFTAAFSGLAVGIDGRSAAPVASRVFSFVLPLSGAEPGLEIPFAVSGFVLSGNAANGHLVFSVNDQSMVADFPANSDNSFVQQFKYKAGSATEARITVCLLADRDSASDSAISLNVTTIDTDMAIH